MAKQLASMFSYNSRVKVKLTISLNQVFAFRLIKHAIQCAIQERYLPAWMPLVITNQILPFVHGIVFLQFVDCIFQVYSKAVHKRSIKKICIGFFDLNMNFRN